MGKICSLIKEPTKWLLGGMAAYGAGKVIGEACKYVPIGKKGPIVGACTVLGISGLALAAGDVAKDKICENVDKTFPYLEVVEAFYDTMREIRKAKEEVKAEVDAEKQEEEPEADENNDEEDVLS